MVLSTYEKQRILVYCGNGLLPSQILSAMQVEGIFTYRQTVARFTKRLLATGTISRKEGSGRPSKITDRVLELVEVQMRAVDEKTATQLHILLTCTSHGVYMYISLSIAFCPFFCYLCSVHCSVLWPNHAPS